MADGQVSFFRPENVKRCKVEKNNTIVRQIEKSKKEEYPDLSQLQDDRLRKIQQQKKQYNKNMLKQKELQRLEKEKDKEARSYDRIFENMDSNAGKEATEDATAAEEYEDDFF
jgi:hypothetical protein